MKLIVDEKEFTDFYLAIRYLEWKYGFAGEAWYQIVKDQTFKGLVDFLNGDGVHAELDLINN